MNSHFKSAITLILFLVASQTTADCFFDFNSDNIFLNGFEVDEVCEKQFYFERINTDKNISGVSKQIVIQKTISVTSKSKLLIISDGRFAPINGPAGYLRIEINGDDQYSTTAIHDWSTGTTGLSGQHSFNLMAYRVLPIGTYTIALIASAHPSNSGDFLVGSGTALSIMIDPTLKILTDSLTSDSNNIQVTTYNPPLIDINEGDADRPFIELLANTIPNNNSGIANVLSYVGGRAYQSCTGSGGSLGGQGDALWGFWVNNTCPTTSEASWGANDLYQGAELQTSMYAHSLRSISPQESLNIKFGASELAFGSNVGITPFENDICYKVANTKLISILNNGISGGAGGNNAFCSTYGFECVASTLGLPGCPNANTDVTIASKTITIPNNHSGILFFSAKGRIQAGSPEDSDMVVSLGIKIDGSPVGTVGVQQLYVPEAGSTRTLTASYLSAVGSNSSPLSAGNHTIEVYVHVNAVSAKFPSFPNELNLTYFDFD